MLQNGSMNDSIGRRCAYVAGEEVRTRSSGSARQTVKLSENDLMA